MKTRAIPIFLTIFYLLAVATYIAAPNTDGGYIMRNVFYLASPAIAIVLGRLAIWHYGVPNRHALSLLWIMAGLSFWFVGEVLFFAYSLEGVEPFPSLADYFYVAGYIPLAIGFIKEVNISRVRLTVRETFWIMLFAFSLMVITLYVGLVLAYDPTDSVLVNSVAIGYAIGDLILVFAVLPVVLFVYRHRKGRVVLPWIWYMIGLLLIMSADLLYAMHNELYDAQDPVAMLLDLLWIAGYLSFASGFAKQATILKELRDRVHPNKSA